MTHIRRLPLIGLGVLLAVVGLHAQTTIAARLDAAIKAAGVQIVGVSIGDPGNKATWHVQPPNLQTAAQPTIDAFNPNNPAFAVADADAKTDAAFNDLVDDVLTALIEQWPAMQADASVGSLGANASIYKQRIRSRVRALRRAKPQNP